MADFQPGDYGRLADLIQFNEPMALGPGAPHRPLLAKLDELSPSVEFFSRVKDSEMAQCCISGLLQDIQHSAQRFGRTPQQLITHGKCGEVFVADVQLAQPSHRYVELAGYRGW